MSSPRNFEDVLPTIEAMDIAKVPSHSVYVGAVGFEDRAFACLDEALKFGKTFDQVIAIEYRPFKRENRRKEFQEKLEDLDIVDANAKWVVYDRCKPDEFLNHLSIIKEMVFQTSNVVVDISAMSKLLIMMLLQGLRYLDINLTLVYAEAEVYHPIREKFEAEKKRYEKETESLPIFLTTGLYDIVTTTSLSTTAMQGYPLMMIAFPTFNRRELTALVNEITPEHLILLEGRPHEAHDQWRLEAI